MDNKKLHLFGKDKEDYKIFSSLLQDAAVPISEIKFDEIRNQFFLTCSRFLWERKIQNEEKTRVLSGICFDKVKNVKKKNFPSQNSNDVLNLLFINKSKNYVEIVFSNNIILRLEGDMISFRLDDFNKEWPTIFLPQHSFINNE